MYMLNRRECFKYLAGALGLAAVPVVAKTNRTPCFNSTGEFIIYESVCDHASKYKNLWISPEALADIKSWDHG